MRRAYLKCLPPDAQVQVIDSTYIAKIPTPAKEAKLHVINNLFNSDLAFRSLHIIEIRNYIYPIIDNSNSWIAVYRDHSST